MPTTCKTSHVCVDSRQAPRRRWARLQRLTARIETASDRWIPQKTKDAGVDAVRGARIILVFTAALVFWALVFACIYQWIQWTNGAIILLVGCLLATGVPLLLRHTGSLPIAGNYLVLVLFAILAGISYFTQGYRGPTIIWTVCIPLVATCTVGRSWGLVWTVLTIAEVVIFYLIECMGGEIPCVLTESQMRVGQVRSLGGILLLVALLALLYEWLKSKALNLVLDRERELEDALQRAEAATRAKNEFLANMSHEIRTPMTAILGFADMLVEDRSVNSAPRERVEAVRTIKRNGEYLLNIINDILDVSKIEAGKLLTERIASSPCQLVAEVSSLARVRADEKGLPLNITYGGAIPETIQSDPTRLRQILINLIGNAIKFTDHGEVGIEVRLVDAGGSPALQFDVVDTGVGMSEEQAARLFRPFTQADASTTRRFGGTGLGLAISKRLADMLGGDIVLAETEVGVGSRFRLTVATGPLDGVKMIDDPVSATVVAGEPRATGDERLDLSGCRVLLAEDGPDNQRLISFMLKRAGAEVIVEENGQLAVDRVLAARDEGRPFDIILMDMQMPVMDGYDATRLLRDNSYTGPIIALTAHAMASDRQKCLSAGCDDYATKPIKRAELNRTILRQLQRDKAPLESCQP